MPSDDKIPTPAPQQRGLEPVEVQLIEAQIEVTKAQRQGALAVARQATAAARRAEIDLEREQTKRDREVLADDWNHHRYHFDGSVSGSTVEACIKQLKQWDRHDATSEIEISFSSPGGSVLDGMELFDFISLLRGEGRHKITTSTYGMAASMAGILLQAGDVRVAGKQAYILVHQVSFGASGKYADVKDEVKFVEMIQKRVIDIFARRCADAANATDAKRPWMPKPADKTQTPASRLTKKAIEAAWDRTDWWINADDALAFGLVDEVRG